MFFAETLGPAITKRAGAALFEHVQVRLGARTSASADELRAIVTEFIVNHRMVLKPDAAIQWLAANGRVAQQDAMTFRLAA